MAFPHPDSGDNAQAPQAANTREDVNEEQISIPPASSATITNMGGREWTVRVLEDDGVTPAKNCPSPATWVEQYYLSLLINDVGLEFRF
jgi:hypothetical protein